MFIGKENQHNVLSGISFTIYSAEDIQRLSVREITNPKLFDDLSHATSGGLYDPVFGPTERDDVCGTCGQSSLHCPGHMGHIVLPLPVYNAVLFKVLLRILKLTCFHCHRVRAETLNVELLASNLKLLERGLVHHLQAVADIGSELAAIQKCPDDLIIAKFREYLESAMADSGKSVRGNYVMAKNVVELRQDMINEFTKEHMKESTPCPHCKAPARRLRSAQQSKIFFSTDVSKTKQKQYRQSQETKKAKRKQIRAGDDDPEVTEEDDDIDSLKDSMDAELTGQVYLTPVRIREHLALVWKHDSTLLQYLFGALKAIAHQRACPTDVFFIDCVPVPASKYRPIASMGDKKYENRQTANLSRVLQSSILLRELIAQRAKGELENGLTDLDAPKKGSSTEKLQSAWIRLQTQVNCIVDSDLDKFSKDAMPGIKQLLEKKEGLFRKNMMGKRVDFAARSVISPDPYINTDEVGIPDVFAKKLTYPEVVTPWNVQELAEAVCNGPEKHPGAVFVIQEDGNKVMLHKDSLTRRQAVANQLLKPKLSADGRPILGHKKVLRHLKNGDVLLMNRQPTLHRPSIQAHKARVLTGEKTLRLHYANCKAYNADFDGDEMNAHFPQNELGRAEAYHIVSTNYQYLVPKDGTPLAGLIQDHMISGVLLTMRGRFFGKHDYQQLVYSTLTHSQHPVKTLRPALIKPSALWSGKQVISTVLLNLIPDGKPAINLDGKAKIPGKSWNTGKSRNWAAGGSPLNGLDMSESEVIIRQGELLVGVLDKAHYGATPYSLVHCFYELYGPQVAGKLLTALARVFTIFLQYHGFSLGVEDILCTPKADQSRRKVMEDGAQSGPAASAKAFKLDDDSDGELIVRRYHMAHFNKDDSELKELDHAMKGFTDECQNQITKACMPTGLHKMFPKNNLQLMVQSGAKGSTVNTMQISCLLGQIELEGRRPPLMMSGRGLPSFRPYDVTPRAGGFVDGRFLTGIRPQEYFFHCMAGREGLIDTAVKTSRSGYLQRCIIKHLEGIQVAYDLTVRDSDGSIVQFSYGNDSLDVPSTQFLNEKQFPFLIQNEQCLFDKEQIQMVNKKLDTESAIQHRKKLKKEHKNNRKHPAKPFQQYCIKRGEEPDFSDSSNGRCQSALDLAESWRNLGESKKKKYIDDSKTLEPTLSKFRPDRYFGAISDRLDGIIDSYITSNPDKLLKSKHNPKGTMDADRFQTLLNLRISQSVAEPGQAVGLLAAQSIGEPSTQMTLNTFHFAGRGEMNVTLGIPRLREILMIASASIKTPAMEIPVLPHVSQKEAHTLQKKLTKVTLADVLEDMEVSEYLSIKSRIDRSRVYKIRLNCLPPDNYDEKFYVTPAEILHCIEKVCIKEFITAIKKKCDAIKSRMLLTSFKSVLRSSSAKDAPKDAASSTPTAEDEADHLSDDDQYDGDATMSKTRKRYADEQDYDGEQEEKDEVLEEFDDEGSDVEQNENENEEEADDSDEGEGHSDSDNLMEHSNAKVSSAKKRKRKKVKEMDHRRINGVLNLGTMVEDYKYDAENELWCEITFKADIQKEKVDMTSLLEAAARKIVMYETPRITRGILSTSRKPGSEGQMIMKTEGVNIPAVFQYRDLLDLNQLYCNEIHAIYHTYGIEAACRVIIKEIRDVFAAYGINVDYRHLSLIADYMTFEGQYKPFNRHGIESNASPLQKMTFETTMHFLRDATISGARDNLQSPSARIVTGQPVYTGTGSFEVIVPLVKPKW
ncbi:DNA-directed RNA polymerase I subunit RPA1-like [Lineus longissimus]|uniref:DNA-directed RNA polymerase I subunit RPA1-like n=1 Tax=Lineus longissimus TaxID=88925 RepID=UPI002B4DFC58